MYGGRKEGRADSGTAAGGLSAPSAQEFQFQLSSSFQLESTNACNRQYKSHSIRAYSVTNADYLPVNRIQPLVDKALRRGYMTQ